MSARLTVTVGSEPVDRIESDVVVVGCHEDERPLRCIAARADWRMCGALSALLIEGALRGVTGEAALLSSGGGMVAPRLLALGLGSESRALGERLHDYAVDALERLLGLRAVEPALALLPVRHGAVGAQLEALVAGLAEGSAALETALALRLVVARSAAAEAREALARLADQRWPERLHLEA